MLRRLIRQYPLLSYYLLAFGIVMLVVGYWQASAWVYEQRHGEALDLFALVYRTYEELGYEYINFVATLHIYLVYPLLIPSICFGLAPTISAFSVQAVLYGREGCRALLRRLLPFGNGASKKDIGMCYGLITVGTFLLYAIFLTAQSYTGGAAEIERARQILGLYSPLAFISAFLVGALLDEGGLLEELGWRGFALPLLIERLANPLLASVYIGLLWAAWHLPREVSLLVSGKYEFLYFFLKQIDTFASGVSVSVVMTYFFCLSGGSVVPAIMIHGLTNFFAKTFYYDGMPLLFGAFRFQTFIEIFLALLIVCIHGAQLGSRAEKAGSA